MRAVLKVAAYRRLLAAYAFNELAWSIGSVSLALLVYRRTGSALGATGFFLCSQFVPALLAPALVARLDQLPARAILPGLYAIEATLFLALALIVASRFALVPVLALALVDGTVALIARPLARAATTAVISPAGLLHEGNALTNGAFSVCYMAGPALGGTIVVAGGTSTALFTNAGLFALIALTVGMTRGLPGAVQARAPSSGRLRSALAHARARPSIRVLLTLQAAAWALVTIAIPVEVVFAQHSLHAGAGGYAALLSAWGVGAIAGSAVYARWNKLPARTLIAAGAGSFGVGFIAMATAPSLAVAIAGAAIAGVGNGIEPVAARTALQEHVEQQWMALMMALSDSIYEAVPGVGILLGGAIVLISSPRVALAVAGAGALAATAAIWVVLRPGAGRLQTPIAEPATETSSGTRPSNAGAPR